MSQRSAKVSKPALRGVKTKMRILQLIEYLRFCAEEYERHQTGYLESKYGSLEQEFNKLDRRRSFSQYQITRYNELKTLMAENEAERRQLAENTKEVNWYLDALLRVQQSN
jgi:hypothetical protein